MSGTGLLSTYACALVIFISIIIIGIYGKIARFRFVSFTNKLRRTGKYAKWAHENRILLFLENFFLYAFLASFLGFMIAGVLKLEEVARFLLICFILICVSAVSLSFFLYRKVPKD